MKWAVKGPWTYSFSQPMTSNGRWSTLTFTDSDLKSWNSTSRIKFAYFVDFRDQTKFSWIHRGRKNGVKPKFDVSLLGSNLSLTVPQPPPPPQQQNT